MRLATIAQAREIDLFSVKAYGLTDELLMESAGIMAAREIQQSFYPELTKGMTSIVCGPGHNGADGLVLARHLHSLGYRDLLVVHFAPKNRRSTLFKIQMKRAELHGVKMIDGLSAKNKVDQLKSSVLVVDALYGIGFKNKKTDESRIAIDRMNALKVPIVALDVPSGLDSDRGVVATTAVKAQMTISFGLAKPGFFVCDGPQYVGKLRVISIGYPYECLRGIATTHFLFNEKLAKRYLPTRKDSANKSNFGRLGVIAGSPGMWGAAMLCAQSAYRIGTGYVVWGLNEVPLKELSSTPEVMTQPLLDLLHDKRVDAFAVGPGLGVTAQTADVIKTLKSMKIEKVVIDADAITAAVKYKLFPFPKSWVITPHAGELARILGCDASKIENDRFWAATEGARVTGCHVLLKGFRTVLAEKTRVMTIHSGNSALAKAGTGDVLTGMIGGLLAQGLDTIQAAATASYVHGRMADEWIRSGQDKRSLSASDLRDLLPSLLNRISHSVVF
jgi:hydroxyethylthiazole kinase-like uncharacterized protein yjeF